MEAYRLFWVGTLKIKPGKAAEAQKWWREKGAPDILSDPWTKSLKCYAVQFGLGGEYGLEVWQEIENYAAFDRMDRSIIDNPEKSRQSWQLRKVFANRSHQKMGIVPLRAASRHLVPRIALDARQRSASRFV